MKSDPSGLCSICYQAVSGAAIGFVAGVAMQYGGDVYSNIYSNGFSSSAFSSNLSSASTYISSGVKGGLIGVIAGPIIESLGGGLILSGAAAAATSVGVNVGVNYMMGQPNNWSSIGLDAAGSAITAGVLSSLPKVPGRLPNLGTKASFVGKHTQQKITEEFFGNTVQSITNSVAPVIAQSTSSLVPPIVNTVKSAVNKFIGVISPTKNKYRYR